MVLTKDPREQVHKHLRVFSLVQETCATATAVAEAFLYPHCNNLEDHYARKHKSQKLITLSALKDRWSSLPERISLEYELSDSLQNVVNLGSIALRNNQSLCYVPNANLPLPSLPSDFNQQQGSQQRNAISNTLESPLQERAELVIPVM